VAGLGQLFGSVLTGAIWNRTVPGTGLRAPFAIAGALAVVAAVLLLFFSGARKRSTATSSA
jgi:uncharacterized membrane protein